MTNLLFETGTFRLCMRVIIIGVLVTMAFLLPALEGISFGAYGVATGAVMALLGWLPLAFVAFLEIMAVFF